MDFLNKLLSYYSLNEEQYKYLSRPISEISLPIAKNIKGIDKITSRILKAIKKKEKIIIYGDYDCDGISATSIMVETFNKLNYEVSFYIPSRYLDGYGLCAKNVQKIKDAGFNLIICVDNGVSCYEAINLANSLGIDVIVIDHHEINFSKPLINAYALLHPEISEISTTNLSAGYLSLILSSALLDSYDDYLVTLAGLSTISDMMELIDINRDVVRLAINNLNNHKYLNLMLLSDSPFITEKTFSMEIAPKINAVGRMIEDSRVNFIVKYLTSIDNMAIYKYHSLINEINLDRKALTKDTISSLDLSKYNESGIVIKLDIKEGLVGLIANRLTNEYNKPSIVFTFDSSDKSILKGSIRSKEGFNVIKAFDSLSKYLLSSGGHSLAGGLSIKDSDFSNFRSEFISLTDEYKIIENVEESILIELSDISSVNYKIFRSLAPYGTGFKEPTFLIKDLPTKSLKFISGGKHLSTPLTIKTKLLGFNMSEIDIKEHKLINIYGNFFLSTYQNKQTLEFRINKYDYSD